MQMQLPARHCVGREGKRQTQSAAAVLVWWKAPNDLWKESFFEKLDSSPCSPHDTNMSFLVLAVFRLETGEQITMYSLEALTSNVAYIKKEKTYKFVSFSVLKNSPN